jgi:hypothetical protein
MIGVDESGFFQTQWQGYRREGFCFFQERKKLARVFVILCLFRVIDDRGFVVLWVQLCGEENGSYKASGLEADLKILPKGLLVPHIIFLQTCFWPILRPKTHFIKQSLPTT